MRAMFLVVASVLLAAGLFGCNKPAEQQAAAPVAVAPPPAALPPPPPPQAPVEPATRHHRRHYANSAYSSYDESGTAESSSEYSTEYSASESGDGYADIPPPPPPLSNAEIWVDGYGREHLVTGEENPGHVGAEYRHARRDPWHGYAEQ